MEQLIINGRTVMVTPAQMDAYKKALVRNRDQSRRISRELKEARLLPSSRSGIGSAHSGYVAPEKELDTRTVYRAEKVQRVEDLWVKHLQAEGL